MLPVNQQRWPRRRVEAQNGSPQVHQHRERQEAQRATQKMSGIPMTTTYPKLVQAEGAPAASACNRDRERSSHESSQASSQLDPDSPFYWCIDYGARSTARSVYVGATLMVPENTIEVRFIESAEHRGYFYLCPLTAECCEKLNESKRRGDHASGGPWVRRLSMTTSDSGMLCPLPNGLPFIDFFIEYLDANRCQHITLESSLGNFSLKHFHSRGQPNIRYEDLQQRFEDEQGYMTRYTRGIEIPLSCQPSRPVNAAELEDLVRRTCSYRLPICVGEILGEAVRAAALVGFTPEFEEDGSLIFNSERDIAHTWIEEGEEGLQMVPDNQVEERKLFTFLGERFDREARWFQLKDLRFIMKKRRDCHDTETEAIVEECATMEEKQSKILKQVQLLERKTRMPKKFYFKILLRDINFAKSRMFWGWRGQAQLQLRSGLQLDLKYDPVAFITLEHSFKFEMVEPHPDVSDIQNVKAHYLKWALKEAVSFRNVFRDCYQQRYEEPKPSPPRSRRRSSMSSQQYLQPW